MSAETDPRVPKRGAGNPGIVVCNHTGFLEIFALIASPICPGFTPRHTHKDVPVLNRIIDGLQSLYVDRGQGIEGLNKVVETMIERQRMVEERGVNYPPFAVFAEGTTTNGRYLLPFKRGAFQGMRTVIPSFTIMQTGMVSPLYDTCDMFPLWGLMFSSLQPNFMTLKIMPEFTPNTKMLEMHADKGEDPW